MTPILYIIASVFVAVSSAIDVNKCTELFGPREGTHGSAEIQNVHVNDCEEAPCRLLKGGETTISFDFKTDKQYNQLTTSVYGGIGIIQVPFRGVNGKNACDQIVRKHDGQKGCPLEGNTVYTYSNSFPILKSYPAVSVDVQYGLNSANKEQVVCFKLPARITNP